MMPSQQVSEREAQQKENTETMSGYFNADNRILTTNEQILADKMHGGYFLVLSGRTPKVISCGYIPELLMTSGPFATELEVEDECERIGPYFDEDDFDFEFYWCGPDDEPMEKAA